MKAVRVDQIGYWSELKLEIVRKYASAYSTVISNKRTIRRHVYIDAFAGAGVHISRQTGQYVLGSPLNALNVNPPFKEFHFIDLDGGKAAALRKICAEIDNVYVYEGDCNTLLINKIFPLASYKDFRRALCLLDPYGLHVNWDVLRTAGTMRSIEVFLNFPVMDMNMNVLWRKPEKVQESQLQRMNAFWGDDSWHQAAYTKTKGLFESIEEKVSIKPVVRAYRKRLKEDAGFAFVPEPIPMRNSTGAIVYYLFFASPNETGAKIVDDIFGKYKDGGGRRCVHGR